MTLKVQLIAMKTEGGRGERREGLTGGAWKGACIGREHKPEAGSAGLGVCNGCHSLVVMT